MTGPEFACHGLLASGALIWLLARRREADVATWPDCCGLSVLFATAAVLMALSLPEPGPTLQRCAVQMVLQVPLQAMLVRGQIPALRSRRWAADHAPVTSHHVRSGPRHAAAPLAAAAQPSMPQRS